MNATTARAASVPSGGGEGHAANVVEKRTPPLILFQLVAAPIPVGPNVTVFLVVPVFRLIFASTSRPPPCFPCYFVRSMAQVKTRRRRWVCAIYLQTCEFDLRPESV